MPSWKTLNKSELEMWETKLKEMKTANSDEQKKVVGEYYQYLIENNHNYGNLAYQASQNTGFAGRLANKYLKHIAQKENVELTNNLRQTLMVHLALSDVQARSKNEGNVIDGTVIHDYHIRTFEDKAGLSPQAWTGTLLEKIGPGAFMLGQGPEDQHGGHFTVDKLQNFLKQATKAGSETHRDTAHFLGVLLNDHIVCEALVETPFIESIQFAQEVVTALKGNKLDLLTQPDSLTLGAQWWVRGSYRKVFEALKHQANQTPKSIIPTPAEMQMICSSLIADPLAMDKQLAHELWDSPETKLVIARSYTYCFQKMLRDINPTKEAQVEYARLHEGKEMPSEWVDFITQGEPLPLSTKTSTSIVDAELLELDSPSPVLETAREAVAAEAPASSGFWDSVFSWFSSSSTVKADAEVARVDYQERQRLLNTLGEGPRANGTVSLVGTTRHEPSIGGLSSVSATNTGFSTVSMSATAAMPNNPVPQAAGVSSISNTVNTSTESSGGRFFSFVSAVEPIGQMAHGVGATRGEQGASKNSMPLWGPNSGTTWADFAR